MSLVAGQPIQLDQRQFHFRMPRKQWLLIRSGTKVRQQKLIYKSNPSIQQGALSGCAVISDPALQQVSDAIKFVAMLLRLRLHTLLRTLANVIRVQVSSACCAATISRISLSTVARRSGRSPDCSAKPAASIHL